MSSGLHWLKSWQKTAEFASVWPYSRRALKVIGSPGRKPRGSRSRLNATTLPICVTRKYARYSDVCSEKSVIDGWLRGPNNVGMRSVPET